jgi:hypothetical protein
MERDRIVIAFEDIVKVYPRRALALSVVYFLDVL